MQDDAELLYRSPANGDRSTEKLRALGVDRVRLTPSWACSHPPPGRRSSRTFDATYPREYGGDGSTAPTPPPEVAGPA